MPLAAGAFSEVVQTADARGQAVALKTVRGAQQDSPPLADSGIGAQVLRTAASLHDRPAAAAASCAAEAQREANLQCLVAHANVVRVLQPPLGAATFALEWCDFDLAKVRDVLATRSSAADSPAEANRFCADRRRRFPSQL